MATIIKLQDILAIVKNIDVVGAMKEAFVQYSNGNTVVPPIAELLFEKPKGDTHIKYGYIKDDEFYCIKVASGFYENPKLGISSSQGLMLLFNQKTGEPVAILLDQGKLTDIRTAAAGASAKLEQMVRYTVAVSSHGAHAGSLESGLSSEAQEKLHDHTRQARQLIADILEAGVAEGVFRTDLDVTVSASLIQNLLGTAGVAIEETGDAARVATESVLVVLGAVG